MKSSGTIQRANTTRNTTVAITLICLLAGLVFIFNSTLNHSPAPTLASPQKNPTAIRLATNESTAAATTDALAPPPAMPAAELSPSPILPDSAFTQAMVEIALPLPPSGDYELELTAEQINAMVESKYGKLFQALGLPPEQSARLRSLLAERQQATVDAANAALLNGLNPITDLSIIRRAIEQAQSAIDTTLRGELGEPVFAVYRDFDRTLKERNSVGDFARLLAVTPEPLRQEQEIQMLQILRNSSDAALPADIGQAIFGDINTRAQISEQATAATAKILSPHQRDLFRQLQQHWTNKAHAVNASPVSLPNVD